MLDKAVQNRILELVRQKPCTVKEVATVIDRNWRTAERYIEQISQETGLISSRTFREGTRGALRIVYWNALEPGKGSAYQERLVQRIVSGRRKEEFSPFDIYQFLPEGKRSAYLESVEFPRNEMLRLDSLLSGSASHVLFFSGNMSWFELGPDMHNAIVRLIKKRVPIKILSRIDITNEKSVAEIIALNKRVGYDAVQIRHCEQPLRGILIDSKMASLKEVLSSYHGREIKKKRYIFYRIEDEEWVLWLEKVFYMLWNQSVEANVRLEALSTLRKS